MVISQKYKICFVHMPKTAGQWVTKFLHDLDPSFIPARKSKWFSFSENYSKDVSVYEDIPPPARLIGSEYYKFGFVRDPVCWYSSLFKYETSVRKSLFRFDPMVRGDNINEYIKNIKKFKKTKLRMSVMYNHIFSLGHDRECTNIFKYEDLYNALLKVLSLNGIDASDLMKNKKTEKINSSNSYCGQDMNQESLDFIYESCKGIYDKFEYKRRYA